jgi:hypothetical protein
MPMLNRNTLIEEYVKRALESMDMDDMYNFIYDTLCDQLDDYTDTELQNEVAENYPNLLVAE